MDAPVILERPWRAPGEVLAAFADEAFACGLIGDHGWSYVARAPSRTLVVEATDPGDPFAALRDLLGPKRPRAPQGPPFQGGVIALAAYEFAAWIEPFDLARAPGWPDLIAARYEALLAFAPDQSRVLAIGADRVLAEGAAAWLALPRPAARGGSLAVGTAATAPPAAYEAIVERVRDRIAAGDLFQANLAQGWRGELRPGARPFDVFERLHIASPAPFAAYLRLPGAALVSNSPERFLSLTAGEAVSRPIKGTRPRADDPVADAALAADLLASDKDRAENLMIVDLMRNDLARVCEPGSVRAEPLFALESFANVHHLVSTVTGRLAKGADVFDLLRAAFPPGSVTGAPKVQAMKLIAALEAPRGPYCGSLLWADAGGDAESSVLIRSLAFTEAGEGWTFEMRAGAGLTAPSNPLAEQLETQDKIRALRHALEGEP